MSASAALGGNPWANAAQPALSTAPPTLLDLLGAKWQMGVPVAGVAWLGDLAGFALADGSVAMARAEWDGAPRIRPRDGGIELTPAHAPPPPVMRQRVHAGACLGIAATPDGFMSGGEDGTLCLTPADASVSLVSRHSGGRVSLVAAAAGGRVAWATGKQVYLGSSIIELPAAATAMAFDAAGARLAVGHYQGVTVCTEGDPPCLLQTRGFPRSVAWSRDGAEIAAGLQEHGVVAWRLSDGVERKIGETTSQPRSIAFSADGWLASSGSARALCWPVDTGASAVECGRSASRMPVCRVAWHPRHRLLAAGYRNGAVLLCQPGIDEVLFARGSSLGRHDATEGDPINALAWSSDGGRLAIGTEGGEIGVVTLPDSLFRFSSPKAGMAS